MKRKILVLSTGDHHGAYEAAYKIAKFLKEDQHEVVLVVRDRTKSDDFIIHVPLPYRPKSIVERVVNKLIPVKNDALPSTKFDYLFLNEDESKDYISAEIILSNVPFNPDVILVGMIDGYGNTNLLASLKEKTNAKIFLLGVDMFPFTGGCHYSWGCKGYETDCMNCPAILDSSAKNWAHKNLMIKLSNIKKADIKIIVGSGWNYEQAKRSTLFKEQGKIYNVNGVIDTRLFNNKHREYAKNIFNIPANSKIIFTGSWFTHDKRKGMSYFVEALNHLWNNIDSELRKKTYILIAGEHTADNDLIANIPFKKHLIDYIKDYRLLSLAYQASDIYVCTSLEDAGPMMVTEAMACGTPVVGFEMGVVYNMVINGYNGYKAEMKNSKDLAEGMHLILTLNKEEYQMYSQNAIKQVVEFSSHTSFVEIMNELFAS